MAPGTATISGIVRLTSNSIEFEVTAVNFATYVVTDATLRIALAAYGTTVQQKVYAASRLSAILGYSTSQAGDALAYGRKNLEITDWQSTSGTTRIQYFAYGINNPSANVYTPAISGTISDSGTFTVRIYAPPSLVA